MDDKTLKMDCYLFIKEYRKCCDNWKKQNCNDFLNMWFTCKSLVLNHLIQDMNKEKKK